MAAAGGAPHVLGWASPAFDGRNRRRLIRVREGTHADLARVAEIKVRSWADTYGPLLSPAILRPFLDREAQLEELLHEFSREDALLLVAVDRDDFVTGFALTFVAAKPAPWLESLDVAPELRGHGTGRQLMQATAASLVAGGYNSLRLGVVTGNLGAARFYTRLGGLLEGVEPALWAEGVTHQVYRWADLRPLAKNSASAPSG